MIRKILLLVCMAAIAVPAMSQSNEQPKREFRGVWMATVINLDWPASGDLPVRFQKEDLISKIEKLRAAGLNVLYFQVRTEGDALYASDKEPWSKYLTGKEGRAPEPFWDPLEFAIEEAHKRGMELHAWLNPYRAMRTIPSDFTQKVSSEAGVDESLAPFLQRYTDANAPMYKKDTAQRDSMHVSNLHPEWLLVTKNGSTGEPAIAIFDPGLPEVMEYTTGVIMDVVNNYDVDGIHFDDYFYPYPPNHMGASDNNSLDDSTFAKYPRGFTNKADWRRNNIDMLVEMIHDSIQVNKPWVKFGISPFGLWKNGVPSGTSGMDAYSVIYGDALAWLEAKTIDYITPQLYWAFTRFGTAQDYGKLADWWADQAAENDLHIYPGHGLYRTSSSTFSGSTFDADEIPRQIRHNRNNEHISGSVFFRTENITTYNSKGFADSLKNNYYRYESLQPVMAWKDTTAPEMPQNLTVTRDAEKEYIFYLEWDEADRGPAAKRSEGGYVDSLVKYAVYRVDASENPDEMAAMEISEHLIGVTGENNFVDNAPPSDNEYWYFITAVSRNNVESTPTESQVGGIVVSNENEELLPATFSLNQNYPNPFNPVTEISFTLPESGIASLKVFDLLGREVQTLINKKMSSGSHTVQFDASGLSSGVYLYRLETAGIQLTRKMTLLK